MNHIEAVILDWAGTVVDYGSVAPTTIFVEAFSQAFDFPITLAEARVPMGMGKWDHIRALGELDSVNSRWVDQFGQPMSHENVDLIYRTFMPLQQAKVVEHAAPIKGALTAIAWMQGKDIKIGSCSGYPKAVMDVLVPVAADLGYAPDCVVASDDLAAGSRPGPWMALENVNRLGIQSVAACVKVDDSVPGIEEGLNAGMWTVGIAITGNAVGMTEDEWQACSDEQREQLTQVAYDTLYEAGAHYVVDALADIVPVMQLINSRLARGERP